MLQVDGVSINEQKPSPQKPVPQSRWQVDGPSPPVQYPSPQIVQTSGQENALSVNVQSPSPQGAPQSVAQFIEFSTIPQVPSPQ
jgi:hypothetical protein